MIKRNLLIAGLFFIASCSEKNKTPVGIIASEKMSGIVWDIVKAQTLATEVARKDSSVNVDEYRKALTTKVFEIHKIKSDDFDKSYEWYSSHPEVMRIMFDSLYTQKQRENDKLIRETFKPVRFDSLSQKIITNE